MTEDRHFEHYFRVLSRWGTPEDLDKLLRWASPEELDAILKAIGPPEDAVEVLVALKERSADWAWMKTGKVKLTFAAKMVILVGATVTVLRPIWQQILDWMQR